jgi:hypothetical protein
MAFRNVVASTILGAMGAAEIRPQYPCLSQADQMVKYSAAEKTRDHLVKAGLVTR